MNKKAILEGREQIFLFLRGPRMAFDLLWMLFLQHVSPELRGEMAMTTSHQKSISKFQKNRRGTYLLLELFIFVQIFGRLLKKES